MLDFLNKKKELVDRLSVITGDPFKTVSFLARRKIFGHAETSGQFNGMKFFFRYKDLSAVDETMIRGEYNFIIPILKTINKPVIADIGMNIGDFAIFCLSHNSQSIITGVEALSETAKMAERNADLNNGKSWGVLNRAAWKNLDTIYLETGSLSVSTKVSHSGKMAVQGMDMQSLFEEMHAEKIDIMKIDIEGAEEEFLLSQPELLKKISYLIVEIHPLACGEDKIRELLNKYFIVVKDIPGRVSTKPLLYCHH